MRDYLSEARSETAYGGATMVRITAVETGFFHIVYDQWHLKGI